MASATTDAAARRRCRRRRASGPLLVLMALLAAGTGLGEPAATGDQVARATEDLRRIEAGIAAGDFGDATGRVNELLMLIERLPPLQQAQVYLAKARLEIAWGRSGEVGVWLSRALAVDPKITLDPVKDPPPLVQALAALQADPARDVQAKATTRPPEPAHAQVRPDEAARQAATPPTHSSPEEPKIPLPAVATANPCAAPFGIGHFRQGLTRDGALYLSTSAAVAWALTRSQTGSALVLTGAAATAALWGFECLDLLAAHDFMNDADRQSLHNALGYTPFGVGQVRNGEILKGLVFGLGQMGLVVYAASAAPGSRELALAGFATVWGLSALEANRTDPGPAPQTAGRLHLDLAPGLLVLTADF